MNGNIYDDIDRGNDSNLYNDNRNNGYDENYDFRFDNTPSRRSLPINYFDLFYRMDRMEKILRDLCRKVEKYEIKEKRRHSETKKLKKRLKKIERQNAIMAECLTAAITQTQNAGKYVWLKKCVVDSAPNIVDLVSDVVLSKRRPRTLTQTLGQPLCLPDKDKLK